jgi:hypothetical protein
VQNFLLQLEICKTIRQDAFAKVSESLRFGQIFDKLLGVLA